jgi:hypothetical protein
MSVNIDIVKQKFGNMSATVRICNDISGGYFEVLVEDITFQNSKAECETLVLTHILPYYPMTISSRYEYNPEKKLGLFNGLYMKSNVNN